MELPVAQIRKDKLAFHGATKLLVLDEKFTSKLNDNKEFQEGFALFTFVLQPGLTIVILIV